MKYHELKVSKQRPAKRVGRGISAGQGKTAGRGTKGQGSRKSPGKAGFEGGQTPLTMRLPKLRGFKSHRPKTENIYTGQLDTLKGAITNQSLFEAGLVSSAFGRVKLVVDGDVKSKHDIKLQGITAKALEMVKKAGGSFEKVDRQARPKKLNKGK